MSTLTMEDFNAAIKMVASLPPIMPRIRVVFTTSALKETTERLFPESRHRSKRITKKLIRRHGGTYRKTPAMWQVGNALYCHPALKPRLEAQFKLLEDR